LKANLQFRINFRLQLAQSSGEQPAIERAGLLLARWADDAAVSITATSLPSHP